MALKDWKRITKKDIKVSGMIWESRADKSHEVHFFPIKIVPSPKEWRVAIHRSGEIKRKKDFEKKGKALKYAFDYMKENC